MRGFPALFSGRPIFDPFRDRAGAPLDLHRRFTLDDADEELRHFLDQTGYLLVERVFARDELARITAAADRVRATARPGDARSWWAKRTDGAPVLCRLIYLGLVAPEIAALSDDPRLRRLAGLVGEPLRPTLDRCDGHSLVMSMRADFASAEPAAMDRAASPFAGRGIPSFLLSSSDRIR